MKSLPILVVVMIFAALMLTSCLLTPGPGGYGVEVAPPLPAIVELDAEPYYYQNGYHYFYQNDRWHYSKSRTGPMMELPRSHWPKEVRQKKRNERGEENRREHDGR